jgi:hypothetical protein
MPEPDGIDSLSGEIMPEPYSRTCVEPIATGIATLRQAAELWQSWRTSMPCFRMQGRGAFTPPRTEYWQSACKTSSNVNSH